MVKDPDVAVIEVNAKIATDRSQEWEPAPYAAVLL